MIDVAKPDDLRSDPDVPREIRYDPDLAVHEPAGVPAGPIIPSRLRSPLMVVPLGLLLVALLVYLLFGLIAHERKRSADYVAEIRLRGPAAWQAAYELSRVIPGETAADRDARLVPDLLGLFEQARGQDPRLRRYLALALGEIRDARALDALAGALADADLETRLYAAWSIGAIGEARGAASLRPLLSSEEADLRKMAAYALGSLDAPEAVPDLRALLGDPVDDVSWNAALALARQGDRSGVPILARLLDRSYLDTQSRPDGDGAPRRLTGAQKEEAMLGALRALRRLDDREHLEAMRRLGDTDPSLRVRQAARETLEALSKRARGLDRSR